MSTLRAASYCRPRRFSPPSPLNTIPAYHVSQAAHVFCELLSIALEHVSDSSLQAPIHSFFSVIRLNRSSPTRLGGPPWRIVQRWRLLETRPAEWCMFVYDSLVVDPARENQLEMVS